MKLGDLPQRIASAQERALEERTRASVGERLVRLREARAKASARERRWPLLAAAAIALASLGFVFLRAPRGTPLRYQVEGAASEENAYMSAAAALKTLRFDDGSTLGIEPGGAMRVLGTSERGAVVALERGTLNVDIVHREDSQWTLAAGHFEVHVIGTHFDASWEPASESLTVSMREGQVRVSGPCLEHQVSLSGTSRQTFQCPAPRAEASAAPSVAEAPSVVTEPTPAVSTSNEPTPNQPSAKATTPGTEETAASLLERADQARYAGDLATARTTYQAVQTRFASSSQSSTALFQLARLDAQAGAWDSACAGFRAYRTAVPRGGLALEAHGRLMECENARGHRDEAQRLAVEYLQTAPNGAFAGLARSLSP